jgi:hypothetical protein
VSVDSLEKKREGKDAAREIGQRVADVVARQLEVESFRVADIGRLFTTRYADFEIDVGIRLTIHRKRL